jgi:hypothetical protein
MTNKPLLGSDDKTGSETLATGVPALLMVT